MSSRHPLRGGRVAVGELSWGPISEPIKGQALTAEVARHKKMSKNVNTTIIKYIKRDDTSGGYI
jgi:hypothetical protein